ncbi:hypothetical protein MKW92_028014 [Papaver armeniacum]|nr:hypothetical protein MKW92_028014 [Papaver armeniacum]
MEGKSLATLSAVVIGVLLTGLFIAQTPVEAAGCSTNSCYITCMRATLGAVAVCASRCGCTPSAASVETNIEQTYATNDFCKLGCVSSMCNKIIDFHTSAGRVSELKEEAENCNNACFKFCNKKSGTAVVAAK